MDGYEVIKRVKTTPSGRDIPIVVMTAHHIDRNRIDILDLTAGRISQAVLARATSPSKVETLLERAGRGQSRGSAAGEAS